MASPFVEQLGLVRRGKTGVDGDGNDVNGDTVTVVSGLFAPGGSTESTNDQQQVIDQPQALFPFGTDVNAVDAVVTNPAVDGSGNLTSGDVYEVAGDAASWQSPFGARRQFGVAVPLKRVTG